MYPGFNNIYYWMPQIPQFPLPVARQAASLKKLCIFELPTTNVALSATSVDYGVPVCLYNQLPCECYVTVQVNQAVPAGGAALPVTIVTPTSGSNTNTGNVSSSGEKKTNVIDHNGNNVIGSDITGSREVFAYLNKREGIIRFVNFHTGTTTAPAAADDTPAPASYSENKLK